MSLTGTGSETGFSEEGVGSQKTGIRVMGYSDLRKTFPVIATVKAAMGNLAMNKFHGICGFYLPMVSNNLEVLNVKCQEQTMYKF